MIEFLQTYGIFIFLGLLFLLMLRAHGHGHGAGGCGMGHGGGHEQHHKGDESGLEQARKDKPNTPAGCH